MQLNMGERPTELVSEVQVFRLSGTYIVSLPGEFFVEYGLELLAGYVTTPAASDGYEADTAILQPAAGRIVLDAVYKAVERCQQAEIHD